MGIINACIIVAIFFGFFFFIQVSVGKYWYFAYIIGPICAVGLIRAAIIIQEQEKRDREDELQREWEREQRKIARQRDSAPIQLKEVEDPDG